MTRSTAVAKAQRSESAAVGPFRLDPGVRTMAAGFTLVGGSPYRVVQLVEHDRNLLGRAISASIRATPAEQAFLNTLIDYGMVHPLPSEQPATLRTVDVVIPCRNDAEALTRLLHSLPLHDFASVTVVDDGSQVPVTGLDRAVRLIRRDGDHGPGQARQVGWQAGDADHVLFIDADVGVDGDWLSALLAWIVVPGIGAAAPRVVNDPTTTSVSAYENCQSPLDRGPLPGFVAPRTRVAFVPTAALLVRREALVDIGGFDTGLVGGEDVDLIWRLRASGWRIRYEPAVSVAHSPRRTWRALSKQRWNYGQSNAALAKLHSDLVTPLEISPYSAAAWFLTLFGLRGLAGGVSIGAISTAMLSKHLRGRVDDPAALAIELAGRGNVMAGEAIATAGRRAWFPGLVLASFLSKRMAAVAAATMVIPPLLEFRRTRPNIRLHRWLVQRLVDDASFAAGVWRGSVRHRTLRALRPRAVTLDQMLIDNENGRRSEFGTTR